MSVNEKLLLDARQITATLLQLSSSSETIAKLFSSYATNHQMSLAEYTTFVRTEQLTQHGDENMTDDPEFDIVNEADLAQAQLNFKRAVDCTNAELQVDEGVSLMPFALLLLSPHNDAVSPLQQSTSTDYTDGSDQPLAHYWTACSHNSCAHRNSISWHRGRLRAQSDTIVDSAHFLQF